MNSRAAAIGVVARLRIARAVGEENPVGFVREHIGRRRLRGHDEHVATAIDEHAQDVALDAEIVGDDLEFFRRLRERRAIQIVAAFLEAIALASR